MASRAAAPIEGSASPRKPSVAMRTRSSSAQLGGGVALHRQRQFRAVMPHPSSATSMRSMPPPSSATRDAARAGIERVLDQFLHRRGRPLDHLAGGDAVDDQLGQQPDGGHQGGGGRWRMADA